MKKKIIKYIFIACLILFTSEVLFRIYYNFKEEGDYQSPCNNYTLKIYGASRYPLERMIPFYDAYWDKPCYVELLNSKGKVLKRPLFVIFNHFSYEELEVDWVLEKNKVYFTRSKGIGMQ